MRPRFEDLTREQILALTEDDIKFYIDYRLAENGVILPPHPGEAPEKYEMPEPTEVAYSCRGVLLTSMEEAKILATLDTVVYEDYIGGMYDKKYLTNEEKYNAEPGITKKLFYKKEILDEHAKMAKHSKKIQDEYQEELKKYEKAFDESKEISSFINEVCRVVSSEDYYISRAKDRYEELLKLADDNEQIAFNFFIKAFPVSSTEERLKDFYEDYEVSGISPMSYADFATVCGIEYDKVKAE